MPLHILVLYVSCLQQIMSELFNRNASVCRTGSVTGLWKKGNKLELFEEDESLISLKQANFLLKPNIWLQTKRGYTDL